MLGYLPVDDQLRYLEQLRQGSFFPNWFEPRRRIDKALYVVVMEDDIGGIYTRKVAAVLEVLGGPRGISKSEVSRICQVLGLKV